MKASRFSEAQKAFILKQDADGMPVAGICQATYFNWKKSTTCSEAQAGRRDAK